jgi:hypothetical protein
LSEPRRGSTEGKVMNDEIALFALLTLDVSSEPGEESRDDC